MISFRYLLLAVCAPLGAWAQVAVLDTFNSSGATGAVISGTSWVGNITRNADSITVGGTARDDSGWEARNQSINGVSMTHLRIVARRDAGHVAGFLNLLLIGGNDISNPYQLTVATSAFTDVAGQFTTVEIPVVWPAGFNAANITEWNLGGGRPPTGSSAFRMTFEDLRLVGGVPPAPPTITQQPPDRVIGVGTGTTMTVTANANNSGALRYQWKKGNTPIANATTATLSLANVALDAAGTYQVDVTNDAGTTGSRLATLSVLDARPTQALAPGSPGYIPGGTVTIAGTLTYTGATSQVRWSVMLPDGWTFASDNATTAAQRPAANTPSLVEWVWNSVPTSPLSFTFTLNVPVGSVGNRELVDTLVRVTQGAATGDILAKPTPLLIPNINERHSADNDGDFHLSLPELTRVIELYNTRNGTVRTGAYAVATGASEDGFITTPSRPPGTPPVPPLTRFHSADIDRDGAINLTELSRVIQLYNARTGTVRTGRYHADPDSEDGFNPGP